MTPLKPRLPSINVLAGRIVDRMVADAAALRLDVRRGALGHLLVDAGAAATGGIAAGIQLAEVCMGGLGRVAVVPVAGAAPWRWQVSVTASNPVLACLASQYAGWSLTHGEGDSAYSVLGSGPGRAVAQKEPLFSEIGYFDDGGKAIFVLETDTAPPEELVDRIADECRVVPKDLSFLYAPTQSLAGTVQVTARVLEVALHKAHALGFPLEHIVDGAGQAPLPPPGADFLTAMGRTNDAIIFGGHVTLFVAGPEEQAQQLASQLPSSASPQYGQPFAETFKAVNYDFYAIDPKLFSPASVSVTALATGRTFHAGKLDAPRLDASFG